MLMLLEMFEMTDMTGRHQLGEERRAGQRDHHHDPLQPDKPGKLRLGHTDVPTDRPENQSLGPAGPVHQ